MISIEKAVLADICFGIPLGKIVFSAPDHLDPETLPAEPDTFLFRGDQLALMKALYEQGDEKVGEAVAGLLRAADQAMQDGSFSVTDKPRSRLSEDPHDYQSLAKYWWPNPDTDDGLPYVRHDGKVNPECYEDDFDYARLVRFSETVVLLSLTAFLSGKADYAQRAVRLVEAWFIDSETRQNPDFRLAQNAPGRDDVRWQATIETRFLIYVTEAVRLLSSMSALKPASRKAIQAWFSALLDWMLESEHGLKARQANNNIGFWYDLQCMVYAQFCEQPELAERILREDVGPRLEAQMAADGGLPHELGRAFPKDYVAFSLAAMVLLSRAGDKVGVPLWDVQQGDGRSFQAAHDWLLKLGDARKLVSAVETGARADEDDFNDLGLLLEMGVKLRTLRRVAQFSTRPASALETENELLRNRVKRLEGQAEALRRDRQALLEHAGKLEKRYRAVLMSNSWRLAAPYRVVARWARSLLKGEPARGNYVPRLPALSSRGPERMTASNVSAKGGRSEDKRPKAVRTPRPAQSTPAPALNVGRDAHRRLGGPLSKTVADKIKAAARQNLPPAAKGFVKRALNRAPGKYAAREILSKIVSVVMPGSSMDPLQTLLAARPRNEQVLRLEYGERGLDKEADTFVLYRIVGNDLYPRHKKGQSRENVRFILENEPELADCEKRWVVNRIVDREEEQQIIAMLEEHGQPFIHIPFVAEEYRDIGWDFGALPSPGFLAGEEFQQLEPLQQHRVRAALYRLKNNYVMHNNGARNAALRDGRTRAKWVLPWDGNGFVTRRAWDEIRQAVMERPHLKYFAVPMERVTDNAVLLRDDFTPHPIEEPQLLFRRDALESFNENFCYGRRPKVELFWRLGVPGPWDRWHDDAWDQERRGLSPEAHQFGVAGWVARLNSGADALEQKNKTSFKNRGRIRQKAIIAAIDRIDRIAHPAPADTDGLAFYGSDALDRTAEALREGSGDLLPLANRIVENAQRTLDAEPYSVTQKTTPPPSGDVQARPIFLARRKDGLGERLRALLNAMVAAEHFEGEFRFHWPEDGKTSSVVPKANEIFSDEFLNEHHISSDQIRERGEIEFEYENPFSEIHCTDSYLTVHQTARLRKRLLHLADSSLNVYRNAFEKITLSTSAMAAVNAANNLEINPGTIACHLRSGDIVFSRFRFGAQFHHKTVSPPIALEILKSEMANRGQRSVIVFGQDDWAIDFIAADASLSEVMVAQHLSSGHQFSYAQQTLFDIVLMSRCSSILAGGSGFATVAHWIGDSRWIDPRRSIGAEAAFDIIDRFTRSDAARAAPPLQVAFACQHAFYLAGQLLPPDAGFRRLLDLARRLDPDNGYYRVIEACTLIREGRVANAEQLLREALLTKGEVRKSTLYAIRRLALLDDQSSVGSVAELIQDVASESYPAAAICAALVEEARVNETAVRHYVTLVVDSGDAALVDFARRTLHLPMPAED